MTINNEQLIKNAKHGFEHIKERVLIESKECNPRIIITAEGFGRQANVLSNLLTNKEEKEFYYHEVGKINAQSHRNLKECGCMQNK